MDQSLAKALSVLVIGMITVFVVLLLVVATGNILIRLVNKYSYDKLDATSSSQSPIGSLSEYVDAESAFDKKKLAAIVATVDIVTAGKGKISKIEQI